MTMRIEIIAVGRELVSGRTRDTNSSYVASAFFARGIVVKRISLVDDDPDDIVTAIREALDRGTSILLITGGLGPTMDDRTLQGVAEAAGVRLLADPRAVKMVREKYDELYEKGLVPFPELTRERMKMAAVPSGATPIENPVGVAPAIKLRVGQCTIYCLPGVPGEMEGVFDGAVFPELSLLVEGGAVVVKRRKSRFGDESVISGIIEKVQKKYPAIYVKTKPEGFGKETRISVEFIETEEEQKDTSSIEAAMSYFQELEEESSKGDDSYG